MRGGRRNPPVHIFVIISRRYNGVNRLQNCEQIVNKLKEKIFQNPLTNSR
jgi:hypothetical protein